MQRFLCLAVLPLLCSAGVDFSMMKSKITAEVNDPTSSDQDFDAKIDIPMKVQDFVVGVGLRLGELKKNPESLFIKRTFDDVLDGKLSFDTNFNPAKNLLKVIGKWASEPLGATIGAEYNTEDNLKNMEVSKSFKFDDKEYFLSGKYDFLKEELVGLIDMKIDSGSIAVKCSSIDQDPEISVTYALDADNEITPSISMKKTDVACSYMHKWAGGSLKSKIAAPFKEVEMEWKDTGVSGTWISKVKLPLNMDAVKPKISLSRDWEY